MLKAFYFEGEIILHEFDPTPIQTGVEVVDGELTPVMVTPTFNSPDGWVEIPIDGNLSMNGGLDFLKNNRPIFNEDGDFVQWVARATLTMNVDGQINCDGQTPDTLDISGGIPGETIQLDSSRPVWWDGDNEVTFDGSGNASKRFCVFGSGPLTIFAKTQGAIKYSEFSQNVLNQPFPA